MYSNVSVVYHLADMDGWTSADILRRYLKSQGIDQVNFIPFNYGFDQTIIDSKLASTTGVIYVVDCTLPLPLMKKYGSRMVWIDHHVTGISMIKQEAVKIMENHSKVTATFPWGEDKVAACELTWRYCYPNTPMPLFIQLAGRYDVWDKAHIPGVDAFNSYIRYMVANSASPIKPFFEEWFKMLYSNDHVREHCLVKGDFLLDVQRTTWKELARKSVKVFSHHNYDVAVANVSSTNSTFFDSITIKNPQIAIGVTYSHDAALRRIMGSFFTLSKASGYCAKDAMYEMLQFVLDSDIVSSGGHHDACGFVIQERALPIFISWLKDEIK